MMKENRNRKKKLTPICFLAWDYEHEEELINQRAKEGWQLVRGGLFSHVYERSETEYRYCIDFLRPNKRIEDKLRYYDLHREMGWELINSTFNGWQFFRKKYVPGTTEDEYMLYTDNSSLHEMLGSFIRIIRILQIIIACYMVVGIINFVSNPLPWKLAMLVTYFLALLTFEVGAVMMKCKRVKKKPVNTIVRRISYGLLYTMVISLVFMILTFTTVFRNPPCYTRMQGGVFTEAATYGMDVEVKYSYLYNIDWEIKSKTTEVKVVLRNEENVIVFESEPSTEIDVSKWLWLKKGTYELSIESTATDVSLFEELTYIKLIIE